MALVNRTNYFKMVLFPSCLLLLSTILISTHGLPLDSDITEINKAPSQPQAKQGILEIPKHAATIIRNFIDKGLESYLNFTTPAPNPHGPAELANSILGHYLLGNWYATPPPAPPYNPEQHLNVVQPIAISHEASYMGHTKLVTPPPTSPPPPPPAPSPGPNELSGQTSKPRTRRTTKTPVHILDPSLDPSLSGIYNSYGTLLNTPDEVYWIEDFTKASVIIPLETTTRRPRTTTVATTVKSSTDAEDSDENEEEVGGRNLI